ncbi:E3 ubiquitin-protein ligase RING1 [Heracleum sosnowskyi]|uniref:RING-type E3 ubiquitin transferase n=1 Tax=Heracleum sosnowskyi TaxID=360622 RepID=A0AAD8N7E5_9APIA|nr:E3 ubiquitin-protein ligase RING1 [Heracleum sosnowskyi]
MADSSFLHLQDDEDDVVVDITIGNRVVDDVVIGDAIETLDSTPFWSQNVDEFDIFTSDLEFTIHELRSSTVSNQNDGRSRSRIFSDGSDPDPDGSFDLFDRENQVNFVMGLFDERVEESGLDPGLDSGFGVIGGIDETGMDNLELDFGLGFSIDSRNVDVDDDDDYSGFICADCGDEFFESVRGSGSTSDSGESSDLVEGGFFMEGLRDVEIEVDSGEGRNGVDGDFAFGEGDDDDGDGLRICLDSLQLEDVVDLNNEGNGNGDFEWEEVDGRVDEREVLSMFFEAEGDDDSSVLSLRESGLGESGVVGEGERHQTRVNLEWEVLLNVNNFGGNIHGFGPDEADGYVDHDEYMTAEYETLFAQFGENENAVVGRPPASKNVVENLDLVLITEEDVKNDNALCAVCKDAMDVGEMAKQLPCSHRYHGDCIVPWLGIRNTCPVCRYELPTDDPDYERRKRSLRDVQVQ